MKAKNWKRSVRILYLHVFGSKIAYNVAVRCLLQSISGGITSNTVAFCTNTIYSQKHESILLHSPYVCTERIFDSRPFMYNKIFLLKILQELVAHIFTLLLPPFAFKLVNHSRRSETLNFRKKSKSTSFSFENIDFTVFIHFSKTPCALNS